VIRLILLREVQSGNKLAYGHWRGRMKDRDAWLMLVRSSHAAKYQKATDRRKVTITAFRKRRLDTDNLSGGIKHLRDCLTKCELIVDDSPKWADFIYDQHIMSEMPAHLRMTCGFRPLTIVDITPSTPEE
jgi:hypothetical protein